MRYIVPCVEQLDRAASELQEGSPVSNRLSIILTDNIVELMAHRRCESTFQNRRRQRDSEVGGRYSRSTQGRVLGQRFDEKTKFLLAEGDINESEFNFIRICHAVRNEAYHTGLAHEEILGPLA